MALRHYGVPIIIMIFSFAIHSGGMASNGKQLIVQLPSGYPHPIKISLDKGEIGDEQRNKTGGKIRAVVEFVRPITMPFEKFAAGLASGPCDSDVGDDTENGDEGGGTTCKITVNEPIEASDLKGVHIESVMEGYGSSQNKSGEKRPSMYIFKAPILALDKEKGRTPILLFEFTNEPRHREIIKKLQIQ